MLHIYNEQNLHTGSASFGRGARRRSLSRHLVQLFVRLLVDLHRRHRLLHVAEDHVQVLVVSLGQTSVHQQVRVTRVSPQDTS